MRQVTTSSVLSTRTQPAFSVCTAPHKKHVTNAGTPGGVNYFGKVEEHRFLGNEVKLYEHHEDKLFAMFSHEKPEIEYYVCTINKTFVTPDQCMRATITTNWSWFRHHGNIREGDICAFHFEHQHHR
ncbi:hypothetical protein ZWY2020_047374 [Hordeum vulgare]|nr:hypothetical protein ZWY2020_047374 [Hordeum vulgare]